jgi:hypothetical protein
LPCCSIFVLCIVPQASIIMTIGGATTHPKLLVSISRGAYFVFFSILCFRWEFVVSICEFNKIGDDFC